MSFIPVEAFIYNHYIQCIILMKTFSIAYNTNLIVEITETTVELISSDDCHSLKNEPAVELAFYIDCNYVPLYPWTPLGFLSLLNVCYL